MFQSKCVYKNICFHRCLKVHLIAADDDDDGFERGERRKRPKHQRLCVMNELNSFRWNKRRNIVYFSLFYLNGDKAEERKSSRVATSRLNNNYCWERLMPKAKSTYRSAKIAYIYFIEKKKQTRIAGVRI